ELTHRITAVLEDSFADVWVVGEISNFNRHTSGHIFFTLKDERASIRCVLWKSAAGRLGRDIGDGVEVEVRGRIGVFEKQGNYQVYVSSIRPRGMGALEVAFRKLKEQLEKEGLFDEASKRPLPRFPRRIGVVTSPTGAAVRDIIHVLTRRWPAAEIVLAPARVQGEGAAAEIARGIENLGRLGGIDVMIVGRGGGSLEDLWPFNEEIVARAIYASRVPVVSAVGHETDFSISDFVADVRAPTPSAAAEMVVPDRKEIRATVDSLQGRLARGLRHTVELLRDELSLFAAHRFFRYPQDIVLSRVQAIDDAAQRLLAAMKDKGSAGWMRLERAAGGLARHSPQARLRESTAALKMATFRLQAAERTLLEHRWTVAVSRLAGRLEDLNPDRVLARGYSRTVLERTGRILTRAADAAAGDLLRTHLAQGVLRSKVTDSEQAGLAGRPGDRGPDGTPAASEKPTARPKKKGRDSGPSLFE
ncbi:MAG: exodeoxyribonuclease VII large subunit, partial [Planctomycetota bacterium]|nr:exodeoxyribonuclease VII large subunit [Planctomycetota bacterium]